MFRTLKKTRAGAKLIKFGGPKWLQNPGTVVRSLIDPETAEKTVPPCLARLDKPDCSKAPIPFDCMAIEVWRLKRDARG